MFATLARLAYRFRWPVLIGYAVLLPIAAILGGSVFKTLRPGGYDDPSTESFRARQLIQQQFGAGSADLVPLYTVTAGSVRDESVAAAIKAGLDWAALDPSVERVLSFYNTGADAFVSPDNGRTFAVISLHGNEKEKIEALERLERLLRVDGIEVQHGGEIPVFEALTETTERDLQRAELIAFPITAVLLVVIFGSVVAAGVPLILGAFAIVFALAVVRLMAMMTDLSVLALNVITVLGLGLAIDYSLFILNRYREELPHRGIEGAIVTAVGTTGRAAAFSGVTLAASLVGLFVFPQVFLRSMAIGGIAVTLIAVLIATTLLPALLAVLGPRIDALRLPWVKPAGEESEPSGFWHRLSMWVMRRAPFVAAAVVLLLLVLGSPFLRFRPAKQDFRALGPDVEARQVSEILDREFLPHETTPNLIALSANEDVLTPQAIGELYDYVQWVKTVPGVTRVDSMFSVVPNQTRQQYQDLFSSPVAQQGALGDGLALFTQGPYSRLSVVSAFDVDSPEAQQQVRDLRALPPPAEMRPLVGGNAADLLDTKDSIRSRVPLTLAVIGLVTFVVLFLVYGSITLPIKAMIMNLLSLTASAGIVVWIFQDGRFENILRYESLGTLDVTMPILLFGIVFGLSMDYEVLMLSRVREEYVRTGDNTLAVALGLEKTGRLITSAAALLIVVILAFATSGLTFVKALGIGMAVAIAIDATIVRALLVPSAMRLMGEWNWWAPAPLRWLWERIGVGDLEGDAEPAPRPAPAQTPLTFATAAAGVAEAPASAPVDGAPQPAVAPTVVTRRPAPSLAYLVPRNQSLGEVYQIREAVTDIGRDPRNQFVLTDETVSGFHARITRAPDGGLLLEDRGSSNGTFVNDEPVTEPRRLVDNDSIRLGDVVLALKLVTPAPAPVEAPAVAAPRSAVAATVSVRRRPKTLPFLVETAGDAVGTVFMLREDITSIGRDPRNDIVLADTAVSGFHARILLGLDGGIAIEDTRSTNGTFRNGRLIDDNDRLEENDTVSIGYTSFQLKVVN